MLIASIFVPAVRPFSDLAEGGLGVMFLKYSRENEVQADALGAEYAAPGGWDPAGGAGIPHDAGADRRGARPQRHAELAADASAAGDRAWSGCRPPSRSSHHADAQRCAINRDEYLQRINGIVFGDNPEEGIVRGNEFIHPALRFAMTFPDGWDITNGEEQVVAQEPGNKVFMVLETVRANASSRAALATGLEAAALQHMKSAGYKEIDGRAERINGLDAFIGTYDGNASGIGKVRSRGAVIASGRNTYFVGGVAKPEDYVHVEAAFDNTIQSFRALARDEADNVQSNQVELYTARDGDTRQSIAAGPWQGLREGVHAGDHERPRRGGPAEGRRENQDRGRRLVDSRSPEPL